MEFVGFMLLITVFAVVIGILAQDAIKMWYYAEEREEEEAVAEYTCTTSHFRTYDLSELWREKQAQ